MPDKSIAVSIGRRLADADAARDRVLGGGGDNDDACHAWCFAFAQLSGFAVIDSANVAALAKGIEQVQSERDERKHDVDSREDDR